MNTRASVSIGSTSRSSTAVIIMLTKRRLELGTMCTGSYEDTIDGSKVEVNCSQCAGYVSKKSSMITTPKIMLWLLCVRTR